MTNGNGTRANATTLRLVYDAVVAGYIHDISDRNARTAAEREQERELDYAGEELAPQAA